MLVADVLREVVALGDAPLVLRDPDVMAQLEEKIKAGQAEGE